MPASTTLSRIGRFEFFAILAPGLCLVAVVVLFLTACTTGPATSAAQAVRDLSAQVKDQWPLGVTLLFFAYLVGNILRAIPVNIVDRVCGRLFKWTARKGYDLVLYQKGFPYRPMLEEQVSALQENGLLENACLPGEGTEHSTFNLWKLILCDRSPATFDYTQELEGRVRLFSGMIWAAVPSGVLGLLGVLFGSVFKVVHPSWLPVMVGVAVVSLAFVALLGWRLRRVRAEEVLAVFLGIVGLRQKSLPSSQEQIQDIASHA